jgi:hypothetical protein
MLDTTTIEEAQATKTDESTGVHEITGASVHKYTVMNVDHETTGVTANENIDTNMDHNTIGVGMDNDAVPSEEAHPTYTSIGSNNGDEDSSDPQDNDGNEEVKSHHEEVLDKKTYNPVTWTPSVQRVF